MPTSSNESITIFHDRGPGKATTGPTGHLYSSDANYDYESLSHSPSPETHPVGPSKAVAALAEGRQQLQPAISLKAQTSSCASSETRAETCVDYRSTERDGSDTQTLLIQRTRSEATSAPTAGASNLLTISTDHSPGSSSTPSQKATAKSTATEETSNTQTTPPTTPGSTLVVTQKVSATVDETSRNSPFFADTSSVDFALLCNKDLFSEHAMLDLCNVASPVQLADDAVKRSPANEQNAHQQPSDVAHDVYLAVTGESQQQAGQSASATIVPLDHDGNPQHPSAINPRLLRRRPRIPAKYASTNATAARTAALPNENYHGVCTPPVHPPQMGTAPPVPPQLSPVQVFQKYNQAHQSPAPEPLAREASCSVADTNAGAAYRYAYYDHAWDYTQPRQAIPPQEIIEGSKGKYELADHRPQTEGTCQVSAHPAAGWNSTQAHEFPGQFSMLESGSSTGIQTAAHEALDARVWWQATSSFSAASNSVTSDSSVAIDSTFPSPPLSSPITAALVAYTRPLPPPVSVAPAGYPSSNSSIHGSTNNQDRYSAVMPEYSCYATSSEGSHPSILNDPSTNLSGLGQDASRTPTDSISMSHNASFSLSGATQNVGAYCQSHHQLHQQQSARNGATSVLPDWSLMNELDQFMVPSCDLAAYAGTSRVATSDQTTTHSTATQSQQLTFVEPSVTGGNYASTWPFFSEATYTSGTNLVTNVPSLLPDNSSLPSSRFNMDYQPALPPAPTMMPPRQRQPSTERRTAHGGAPVAQMSSQNRLPPGPAAPSTRRSQRTPSQTAVDTGRRPRQKLQDIDLARYGAYMIRRPAARRDTLAQTGSSGSTSHDRHALASQWSLPSIADLVPGISPISEACEPRRPVQVSQEAQTGPSRLSRTSSSRTGSGNVHNPASEAGPSVASASRASTPRVPSPAPRQPEAGTLAPRPAKEKEPSASKRWEVCPIEGCSTGGYPRGTKGEHVLTEHARSVGGEGDEGDRVECLIVSDGVHPRAYELSSGSFLNHVNDVHLRRLPGDVVRSRKNAPPPPTDLSRRLGKRRREHEPSSTPEENLSSRKKRK
ncbi:uncharacterized protein PHACADRAFT_186705 [Phanerochaete carnosa HHB-10118-sp]|uniref:Uncharacterized protein n=1 Tax=Phanerochaete carnosa (strain HHB-10118-sp) TaxID=650164 RepID=K5VM99_PHACS|nr:uncharacterized protein PHACADRAFT_186705 [Phanerochaete carnosa HHB-10118-sp]EKM52583.1 hypothetical protein PHACADRAFT_186705 [Phanerochaete carnosa HHB-10118-sp]